MLTGPNVAIEGASVPVGGLKTNQQVVAGLNVGAHAQRVSLQDLLLRFVPHLKAAAHELCVFIK